MKNRAQFMSRKILVVEDNADLLDLFRLNFKEEGYAIATATTGIEAVKKTRSLLPDLVVLDVVLPELDGFAVCEILRNDPTTASIPIIIVTGLPGQMSRMAGLESGATEFVTKPVSPQMLVSRVQEVLKRFPNPSDT